MRTGLVVVGLMGLTVSTACSGSDASGSDGFVASQLALVPDGVLDGDGAQIQSWMSDLERATTLMELPSPGPGRDPDDIATGADALVTGTAAAPGLAVFVPTVPVGTEPIWSHAVDIEQATGIDVGAIEQIVSVPMAAPMWIAITTGDLAIDASVPTVAPGVRTYGEGDDFVAGPATSWTTGRPTRLAVRDRSIAWSPSTSFIGDWGLGASLAERPDLAAAAAALDARGSLSAVVVVGDFSPLPPARASRAEVDAFLAAVPDVATFGTVGVGVSMTDDGPRSIVVYVFDSDDDATAAVEPLAVAWRESDDRSGHPVGERCLFVGASAVGRTVAIELAPAGDATTIAPAALLLGPRAVVFTHP